MTGARIEAGRYDEDFGQMSDEEVAREAGRTQRDKRDGLIRNGVYYPIEQENDRRKARGRRREKSQERGAPLQGLLDNAGLTHHPKTFQQENAPSTLKRVGAFLSRLFGLSH